MAAQKRVAVRATEPKGSMLRAGIAGVGEDPSRKGRHSGRSWSQPKEARATLDRLGGEGGDFHVHYNRWTPRHHALTSFTLFSRVLPRASDGRRGRRRRAEEQKAGPPWRRRVRRSREDRPRAQVRYGESHAPRFSPQRRRAEAPGPRLPDHIPAGMRVTRASLIASFVWTFGRGAPSTHGQKYPPTSPKN